MLIGTGCYRYYSLGLLLLFASHSPYCFPTAVRRSVKLCVRWFWLRLVCVCRSRVCCLLIHIERRFHHQHRRSCVRLVCIWISVRVDRRRGRCCIHHFIHTFDEILRFTLRYIYFLFRLNIQSAVDAKVRINQKKIRVCLWLREWFSLLFVVFWFFFIYLFFNIIVLVVFMSVRKTDREKSEKWERGARENCIVLILNRESNASFLFTLRELSIPKK